MHHHDAVGVAENHVHVVLDHDGRHHAAAHHRGHSVHDLRLLVGADAAGWLVEEQQARAQRISDRNVEQLALALRKVAGRDIALGQQTEAAQHVERLAPHLIVTLGEPHHLHELAVAREDRQRDIVEHREPVEQIDDLEAARNARLDPLGHRGEGDVAVVQEDLPAVRLQVGADQVHKCRLAGAVRADERQKLALIDGKIEAVAGLGLAELLAQIDRPQQRGHGGDLMAISPGRSGDRAATMRRRCRSAIPIPGRPARRRAAVASIRCSRPRSSSGR